ncbi:hypothetical protein AVEN_262978-1 [Araneus ventricosus]|uniref:SMB domain-containing protein n=1 Tax=Araneus ventricosus TaxID=182803 RepID=A0A4Y2X751_ARAVE|nr:hypothetical protein AVEN_262978-1 [Araneus ventricosus]
MSNGMETFANNYGDISYSELKDMGADCHPLDNCKKSRNRDELVSYNCNCGSTCPEFDTCCLDSDYRVTGIPRALNSDIKCLPVYRSRIGVFMIGKCQNGDSEIESLCESNGEEADDPFLMIPATSLATEITYKNYFCLVCNEDIDKDQVVLWNLQLQSTSKAVDSSTMPQLRFDNFTRSWMVDDNGTSAAATVTIEIEESITSFVKICKAGEKGLISNCSKEWTDDSIVQKCAAYMATVGFFGDDGWKWYRNPHCALCNYEDVKRRFCKQPILDTRHWSYLDNFFVRLFVLKDEETSCGRKMIFDKFAKKCRCNSRDSVMQDGKCLSRTT